MKIIKANDDSLLMRIFQISIFERMFIKHLLLWKILSLNDFQRGGKSQGDICLKLSRKISIILDQKMWPLEKMKIGKKTEHLIKNAIAALLKKALEQKPKTPLPPYRRILFLRFDALGDMILSFPIYRATRTALPDSEIDVLCSRKNVILLQGSGLIDTLLIAGKNPLNLITLIWQIRRNKYDLVINLVTRPSFTFGLVARLGGPKSVRIAGDQEQFSYFYNRIIELPPKKDIHMMQRKFLVCKDFLDPEISHIDTPWVSYNEDIKKQARNLYVQAVKTFKLPRQKCRLAGINLSAGLGRREWPLKKNGLFLKQCIDKYKNNIDGWLVFTDPEKPEKAGELVEMVNHLSRIKTGNIHKPPLLSRLAVLPPQSDIRVVMEFISYLDVLITPDTSISHAASAMGTAILVLTIGENANVWDPVGVRHRIVFSDDLFSLETLSVEKVMEGFEQLIRDIFSRSSENSGHS